MPAPDAATAALRRALLAWYRRVARPLPWRATRDPYHVWLSEIMLQQTRVETMLPYYARFLAAFPNVQALAAAPPERVLKLWEGLGYYSRARHLHAAAGEIAARGAFPRSAADWALLPGVGRYTAAAIASIAWDEPEPTVDGNIRRVLARLFALDTPLETPATQARLWAHAAALLERRAPGDFNQALMELGATVCTPRGPRCEVCPLARWCAARREKRQHDLPLRRARRAVPHVHAAVAAVRRADGKLLLVRRPEDGLLAQLWTLPGGDLRTDDAPAEALRERVRSQTGVLVSVAAPLGEVTHVFTHRHWQATVYACHPEGRPARRRAAGVAWAHERKLAEFPCARVDRKLLRVALGAPPASL